MAAASLLAAPASAATATRSSAFVYDPATGLLVREIVEPNEAALRLTISYLYDATGNVIVETASGAGIETRSSTALYNAKGQFPVTVANALSHASMISYDLRFGAATTLTDPNGISITWTYDGFGRKTREQRADGTQTRWTYAYCSGVNGGTKTCPTHGAYVVREFPRAADGVTQNGANSIVYYDRLGRVIAIESQNFNGAWVREDTQYDSLARVQRVSRPYFPAIQSQLWINYSYDQLGRVVGLIEPGGASASYGYHGLTTTETNFKGQTTTTVKNPQGLVVGVTDTLLNTTSYSYDPFGNIKTVTDAAGNVSTATYDKRGRKIAANDPDMGTWSYSYDVLDQIKSQTDAKNQTTTLAYDKLGRPTQSVEPGWNGGPAFTASWTYDTATKGKLATAATSQGYTRTESYDSLGRPSQTTITEFGHSATVTTTYDSQGRVATLAYPSGFEVQYSYNARGYLSQVKDPYSTQTYWTANAINADGNLTQSTLGNGIVTTKWYDANLGFLIGIAAGANNSVVHFTYGYDKLGNLLNRSDWVGGGHESFQYDSLNRLTWYQVTGHSTKTVSYNAIGNILTKSDVGTYSYPATGQARPHAVSSISGAVNTNFQYDDNGNMISGKGRTVSWTSFNMVAQVTEGTTAVNFDYDSEHRRIRQTGTAGTTLYFWHEALGAPAEKLPGLTGQEVQWKEYIVVGGEIVGQHLTTINGSSTIKQLRYFVTDHLGSIAVVTDAAGAVLERLAYDAWGKRRHPNGADDPAGALTSQVSRGFTGHEMLDGVGLVHMNGRIYDPVIGRFMSADPFIQDLSDGQALNRYSYVLNNPLSLTDPSGFFFKKLFKKIGKFFKAVGKAIWNTISNPRQLFALLIGAALTYALGPAGLAVMHSVAAAAIGGGVAGLMATGDPVQALIAAATAAAFAGVMSAGESLLSGQTAGAGSASGSGQLAGVGGSDLAQLKITVTPDCSYYPGGCTPVWINNGLDAIAKGFKSAVGPIVQGFAGAGTIISTGAQNFSTGLGGAKFQSGLSGPTSTKAPSLLSRISAVLAELGPPRLGSYVIENEFVEFGVSLVGAMATLGIPGGGTPSRVLRAALERAGYKSFSGAAAHHIVAHGAKHPSAAGAREILERFGIGINEAANGVFLRKQFHDGLHTNKYYEAVEGFLRQAISKEDVIHGLNAIRQRLLNGAFP